MCPGSTSLGIGQTEGHQEQTGTEKKNLCEGNKKAAICKTEKPQKKPNPANFHLGLPASRTVRNKFLLFKPASLWYFVTAKYLYFQPPQTFLLTNKLGKLYPSYFPLRCGPQNSSLDTAPTESNFIV